MNRLSLGISAFAIAVGFGISAPADGVLRERASHGTASCQSALPTFDTNIRKRPQALANEGTSTAFITCDTDDMTRPFASGITTTFQAVIVHFVNRGASAVTISCTLVNGFYNNMFTTYFPKTSPSIEPGAVGILGWYVPEDIPNYPTAPAVSCGLPPSTEIAIVGFNYYEEI